ncbi:MAG: methenyltetrahydromethanopterin cyclohydrolase [Bradyrhizobiaceae bacterium]|nr:methenyltetrahydromethanopterin cyclohydrolase [Bradyrhizobiaceae bacterium]
MSSTVSVNARAIGLVESMVAEAAALRVNVTRGSLGERLIDAGSQCRGGVAAGIRLAEICMGGLGRVALVPETVMPDWPFTLAVRSSHPVIACLGSQYAGWSLAHKEGDVSFYALGSGPARALARTEPLFEHLGYADSCDSATLVLESETAPPPPVVEMVAAACKLTPQQLTFIYAPTRSLAGGTQVVARSLEVALHKAHELSFPLDRIVDGMAAAPLCPPHPDFVTAMGRTNDAIIYGGQVHLFVTGDADEAGALAERLPSTTSHHHGRPFAELFKSVNFDFYAMDKALFSPAKVIVTAIDHGVSFHTGELHPDLIRASFS